MSFDRPLTFRTELPCLRHKVIEPCLDTVLQKAGLQWGQAFLCCVLCSQDSSAEPQVSSLKDKERQGDLGLRVSIHFIQAGTGFVSSLVVCRAQAKGALMGQSLSSILSREDLGLIHSTREEALGTTPVHPP